jgi:fumarylacetoacetase
MYLPFEVRDYTDFLCSRVHAANMGRIMSGNEVEKLMPGFLRHPIAYHGRASSLVVSGTEVVRPLGSTMDIGSGKIGFGPTKQLDFEVEMVR